MQNALPIQQYRITESAKPRKLPKGLDAASHRAVGWCASTRLQRSDMRARAHRILELSRDYRGMKSLELKNRLHNIAAEFRRGSNSESRDDLLAKALAPMCEAIYLKTHLRPYPEQVIGVLALQSGSVAEMATGEGKTLTIGLGAALAAWRGRPCHVITANDYLVKRDADWLREFFEFCSVSVGHITAGMDSAARRLNYSRDITYVTSKEVVADFLRDRLQLGPLANPRRRLIRSMLQRGRDLSAGVVMRGLHTAIIDEADHVLIDEAVTPLIISRQVENSPLLGASEAASVIARALEAGTDYRLDPTYKDIELKPAGKQKIEETCRSLQGIWRGAARREELVVQALHAREFFKKGKQYVIGEDGKIIIVDEFTGRMMPQRTWKQGLHQAIEAKEGLPITMPTETLSRLSFQQFFRLYHHLSGTTGTASEASGEFWQIYHLPFTTIPTHKPCIRKRHRDRLFLRSDQKWGAIVEEIESLHSEGRPVLVGTRSVQASERLAAMLDERDLAYNLLNAVRHREEASIVAEAGKAGTITIATNMAGRGTDIKLGHAVEEMGGMHVIGTEIHEAGRIDRQLIGRCARQGQPGSAQIFFSLEDELVRRFLPRPLRTAAAALLACPIPGAGAVARRLARYAQTRANRFAFRQRRNVLKQDEWIDEALSFSGPELHR